MSISLNFDSQKDLPQNLVIDDQVYLDRLESHSPQLKIVAKAYNTFLSSLENAIESGKMILWSIVKDNQIVGLIQLDPYESAADLQRQITDRDLAQKVFNQGSFLEASMYIEESHRGKGLGSKIIKVCLEKGNAYPAFRNIFMVVDQANSPSNRLLEKYGFESSDFYRISSLIGKLCCNSCSRVVNVYTTLNLPQKS